MVVLGLRMSRSPLLMGGCPLNTYVGKDKMSDQEAAWALNPGVVPLKQWDSVPLTIWQHPVRKQHYCGASSHTVPLQYLASIHPRGFCTVWTLI